MLSKNELENIYGGASKITIALVGGALIAFFTGLIDGYLRPLVCNK